MDDLQKKGIHCDTYIVKSDYIDDIIPVIEKGNYSLICLDSIFTIDIINHLHKQFPYIPILLGGINAISLLVHTDVQYAVFGPGRAAINAFVHQYFGSNDFYEVPNLFFKHGNQVMYSGKTEHWNLEMELFPYQPFLDWQYIGPDRNPEASFTDVSIIAGTGCPYANSTVSSQKFAIEDTIHELGYNVSDAAMQRLEEIFNRNRHGCSFCIFQYQEYTNFSIAKTIELLLRQALYLHDVHNVKSFQIQTENPLPILNVFLTALLKKKLPFHKVSIRTRPDFLLRHKNKLFEAIDLAREKDFCLSIEQIGFESFYDNDLTVFNKNVDAKTNIEVLRLLREIKNEYGRHVGIDTGHGIILFHPWTTLESITETLKLMSQYNDIFPRFFVGHLILYSEFLPIYPKIRREDLVKKSEYMYGLDFNIKDPLANKAYELYRILLSHFGGDISIQTYLRSLELIEDHSIDEILAKVFYLVPVAEE